LSYRVSSRRRSWSRSKSHSTAGRRRPFAAIAHIYPRWPADSSNVCMALVAAVTNTAIASCVRAPRDTARFPLDVRRTRGLNIPQMYGV
jgi:hypothetical protein